MATWKQRLEKVFAAVAFAEAGEQSTALEMIGAREPAKGLSFSRAMAAAAFAEANCQDIAREMMGVRTGWSRAQIPVEDFLASVGLVGVRARYGVVRI